MSVVAVEHVAVTISVVAAICFASEAVLVKRGIEAGGNPILAAILVAGVSTAIYGIVLAVTADLTALATRSLTGIGVFFAAGVASSGLGILAIYQGVERVGASVNTAVVNSRPLFVALLGTILLSETLEPTTLGGIVVLIFGLVLVAFSRGGDIYGWKPIELVFPLSAATLLAFANVARRYGLTETGVPLAEGIAINAVGGLVALAVYVVAARREEIFLTNRTSYAWFVLTGCATSSGLLAMFFALERERVAIVDSIVATAPLFALILTAVFLRDFERITLRVCLGIVFVVIGVVGIVGLK